MSVYCMILSQIDKSYSIHICTLDSIRQRLHQSPLKHSRRLKQSCVMLMTLFYITLLWNLLVSVERYHYGIVAVTLITRTIYVSIYGMFVNFKSMHINLLLFREIT